MLDAIWGWLSADQHSWTIRLVHIAAAGQVLFVVLWATLPWYRTRIGRALMTKSAALGIYLVWAVLVIDGWVPLSHQQGIALALFALITVGIWTQLGALAREMWHSRQERRRST